MESLNWHLKLFNKSILKQNKYNAIVALLDNTSSKTGLDIGADNGVISYLLRLKGGQWYSADLEQKAIDSIRSLVQTRVEKIDGEKTPFDSNFFDVVIIIDFLEHIHTDGLFIQELHRILKKDGILIINVPHIKSFSIIRPLRLALGLTNEKHGHVRPGYTLKSLEQLISPYFQMTQSKTYSRFFTELLDTAIQWLTSRDQTGASSKGVLIDQDDFQKIAKKFKMFSMLYPFFWLWTQLDKFIFFTQGYSLIVKAYKK